MSNFRGILGFFTLYSRRIRFSISNTSLSLTGTYPINTRRLPVSLRNSRAFIAV